MDADRSINECILCKEHLKDKHPKLLSCLHSVCETCFKTLFKTIDVSESKKNEETSEQGEKSETIEDDVKVDNKGNEKTGPREENWLEIKEINCPVCDTIVNKEYVVENLFALTDDVTKQTSGEDEEDMIIEKNEVHICTGCEEEQAAASFCEDCREWLCDQCVFAHRRVRITKDHTITLKAEGSKDEDSASNRGMAMFCQKHKNEPLKLFCETCDLLTCRDCQLLEHKDHKYQFMSDAIIHQRELLQDVVTKVKTKLNNYTQAEKILQKKNDELKGKLDEVCTNITEVTQTVVKKLEEHSDMLIQHLSKYISGKVNVIGDKMRLVKEAILKMDHVVHFVDNALTLGDDMSILYTKGTMMKVLEQLGKTGIPFQHAILQYSVSFEYDKESIAKNTCGVGHLVIDNVRYPSKSGASVTANVVAPTQTMNNNNNSSSIVPRNVPRHTVQPVLPNITMLPEEVQNHILSLPAEKQHETALKLQAAYNKNRPMQQSLPSNSAFPNVGSGSTHAPQSARGYGSMSVPMNTPPFRPRTSNTFLGNQLQRPQNIFGSNYTSSPGQASQYAPRPMHPQGMHPGPISTYATAGITTNPMSAMAASVGGASLVSHGNMSFSANSNAISHPLTSNLSGFQQETILNNRHQVADTCSFSREQGSWYSHVDTNSQSRTSPLQSSQQRFSPGSLEPRSAHVHKTSVPPTGPQNPISPVAPTFAKQDHNERPSCAFNQVRASKRVLGLLLKKVTSGKRNLLSEGAKFQVCEKPVSLQKRNLSSDRVECKECGKTFSVRSNLNRHLNSCHRKLRFRCLKCNRRYGYLTNLKRHEKVCLKQKKPINIRTKFVLEKISSVKGNLSSSGAKNEECEKSFSFKSGNLLSEVVYTCQDCGKTSPAQNENLSSVGAHCQECGNTSLPRNENLSSDGFECKECGKTYSRRSGLNRHFNSCHRKLRFRCLKCKKGYGYLTSLKRHEKICFKRKTHKTVSASTRLLGLLLKKNGSLSSNGVECQVCKKNVFSQNGNLSSESFQCQECEKSVIPQDGNLSSEGVKCQDCGKAFLPQNGNISSDGLKCRKCEKSVSHEIGNVSSEDVRCQECGKTFPLENGNISSHGLKCQECEKLVSPVIGNLSLEGVRSLECGKSFSSQILNHSSKGVKCPECGKTFSRRSNLKSHFNSSHRKLRFRCLKCNRGFGYISNLKRHKKICLRQKTHKTVRTRVLLEKVTSDKRNLSTYRSEGQECGKLFSFPIGNRLSESGKCQVCGKTFLLQNVVLSSDGVKCHECEKLFSPQNGKLSSDGATFSRQSGNLSSNGAKCHEGGKTFFFQDGNPSSDDVGGQECEKSFSSQIGNLSSDGVKCSECGKTFSRRSNLICHFNSSHRKLRFRCLKCNRGFGYISNLKRHEKICSKQKTHKTVRTRVLLEKVTFDKKNYSSNCAEGQECEKSFPTQIGNLSSEGVKCPECGKTFSRRSNLKSHFNSSHRKLGFRCLKCNRGFGYISNLKRHEKICLKQKTRKTASTPTRLLGLVFEKVASENGSLSSNGVECQVCKKTVFSQNGNLSSNNFQCQECERAVSPEIQNVSSEGVKCQQCKKTFLPQNGNFSSYSCKCQECEKSVLSDLGNLSSEGVKCQQCRKKFPPQNGNISSNGLKCQECKRSVSPEIRNLSSESVKCQECGKTFLSQNENLSSEGILQECEKTFSTQKGNCLSEGVKCQDWGITFPPQNRRLSSERAKYQEFEKSYSSENQNLSPEGVRSQVYRKKFSLQSGNLISDGDKFKECANSFSPQNRILPPVSFKCKECGKTFSVKSNMTRHFNNFNRRKRFICFRCNKGFGYISALRRHEKICVKQKTKKTKHATAAPQRSSPMPPPIPQPPPLVRKQTPPPQQLVRNEPSPSPSKVSAGGGKTMPESATFDPNEDYCAVCQNGGDLLCCDICPKVFHLKCHVPELDTYPSGDWCCSLCTKKDDQQILVEKEKKEDFYLATGKRKAPSGLSDRELKACERILLGLYCHPNSTVFHQQVSKSVPNYYKIIVNPMDFGKIKLKLQRQNFNHYSTVEEFLSDIHLVFKNCRIYNDIASEIWKIGKKVEEEAEELIRLYMPCYSDYFDELLDKEDKERRAGLLGLDSIMKTFHPDETRQETPTPDTVPSSVADSQFAKKQRVEEVHEEIL